MHRLNARCRLRTQGVVCEGDWCERVVVRKVSISEIKTVVDKSAETTVEAFHAGGLS